MNLKLPAIGLLLILLALFVDAAPSDYIKLYSNTPFCGGLGEPQICTTIYNITNPYNFPIPLNNSKVLNVTFRTVKTALQEDLPNIKNVIFEYNAGGGWNRITWQTLNLNFPAKSSILLRITGKKQWMSNGDGEEILENVDNVVCVNGECDFSNAWWNSSEPYRRKISINSTNIQNFTNFIMNVSFIANASQLAGKMNTTCNDLLFSWVNQTDGAEYGINYHLYADISRFGSSGGKCANANTPLSYAYVNIPVISANGTNTTLYYYYGNMALPKSASTNATYSFVEDWLGGYNVSKWYNGTGGSINTACANCVVGTGSYTVSGSASAGFVKINNNTAMSNATMQNFTQILSLYKTVTTGSVLRNLVAEDKTGAFTTYVYTTLPASYTLMAQQYNNSRNDNLRLDTGASVGAGGLDVYIIFGYWSQTSVSSAMFTNVTGVSWAPIPFQVSSAAEEAIPANGSNYTITAVDDVSGQNIYFSVSYDNGTVSGSTGTALSHSIALGTGNNTLTFSNTSYYTKVDYFWVNSSSPGTFQGALRRISGNATTNFTAFDEITGASIYFNMTYTNGTLSGQTATALNIIISYGLGLNTFNFYNASYYPRTRNVIITNTTSLIQAYLLPLTDTTVQLVRLHAQNSAGTVIQNVQISVSREVNGTVVTIGDCYTDSTGTCNMYLDYLTSYTFSLAATGYSSQTQTFVPSNSDYTFTLGSTIAPTYQPTFRDVTQYLSPDYLNWNQTWTIINYTVIDANASLILFGFNVTYNGTVIYSQVNGSPATGGVILVNVSNAGRVNNITVVGYWQRGGGDMQYYYRVYLIQQNATIFQWSLTEVATNLQGSGGGTSLAIFLLLVGMIIVGGALRSVAFVVGGGILAVLVMAFLFFFVFPLSHYIWIAFVGFLLLAIALAKVKSGH